MFRNARAISARGGVGNFATKLVAMPTSFKISKREGQIDHLQFNTYYMVQRLWKSVQRILRYFGSERTSPLRHKIGCRGNVPWGIGKNRSGSRIFTQLLSIWWRNCENWSSRSWGGFAHVKKEEINTSKIHSPSGKFAEQVKKLVFFRDQSTLLNKVGKQEYHVVPFAKCEVICYWEWLTYLDAYYQYSHILQYYKQDVNEQMQNKSF